MDISRIQLNEENWWYINIYVERLLGDVVHGFRQMSNVPRCDSSHGDTAVLNNYLAPWKNSCLFTLVRYTEWFLVISPTCSGVIPVKQNMPI